MTPLSLLHLDHISHSYPNSLAPTLRHITLNLYDGELLGVLGPSGCGKTTLLRLIAGFEMPQSGTIELLQRIVAGQGRWVPPERREIGMVFQDYALFPHLTVAQNIAFGLKSKRQRIQAKLRIVEILQLVGLNGFENRYPHQLSGGQQQRVALARALAPDPTLVLLDEPLSNLDVQVRVQLRQELRDILKKSGTAGILVTHDQEEALSICDRIAVMRGGCVEQIGLPEEVYRQPQSRFVAEFVTQANFLPARRNGAIWETELGAVPVCSESWEADGGDVMVRQEDLHLVPDLSGNGIVCDRQFLGREHRYHLQTQSGYHLIARVPDHLALPIGERVQIAIATDTVRVFPTLGKPMTSHQLDPAKVSNT
jgi:iron(III) transport system ATP-binding protein